MTVVCNYIAAVVIFPCLLLFDLERHVNANPDAVGQRARLTAKSEESSGKDGFSCIRCMGALASIVFRMTCVLLSAGFFAFCASGIDKVNLGLDLEDVVPSSSYIYDYALNTRNYFATYQVSLVSSGIDFATTTENQALLEHDFVTAPNVNADYGSVNYLRYLADETTGRVNAGEVCSENTVWLYDYINLSDESLERCASINADAILSDSDKKKKCIRTCMNAEPQMAYAPTTHNPTVTSASQTYRCSYNATNNHCVCPWRQVYNPTLYNTNLQTFLDGGERGQISQSLMITNSTPTSVGHTTISDVRALFYVEDVFSLEDKLNHMRKARKIAENSKLATEDGATVFPFDYALYALNEQYLNIERNTLRGLGISVAIAFVVMYPFVTSLWLDVILTFVIAVIQIELYGLIHWIDLKLNAVTMVNLIMTVGISIEFVIHEARAFAEAKGTRPERAAQALSEMGPAIFASAFTTFLAVLPLVGADYEYFQKYFFSMYAMILFVGLFNALVTLPAILSFIGPPELTEDAVRDSEGVLDKEMV
jgi:predicted RND superfamily exporter protein